MCCLFGFLQWVQEGSPSHSTPIKVESPNQFVPLGTTKKEFKRIQAAVSNKKGAFLERNGPRSTYVRKWFLIMRHYLTRESWSARYYVFCFKGVLKEREMFTYKWPFWKEKNMCITNWVLENHLLKGFSKRKYLHIVKCRDLPEWNIGRFGLIW